MLCVVQNERRVTGLFLQMSRLQQAARTVVTAILLHKVGWKDKQAQQQIRSWTAGLSRR